MQPRIQDGDLALFAPPGGATKQNQVVLATLANHIDQEHGGRYTIKLYTSEKKQTEDGAAANHTVTLSALNPDYDPIIYTEEDAEDSLQVLGLFQEVIRPE